MVEINNQIKRKNMEKDFDKEMKKIMEMETTLKTYNLASSIYDNYGIEGLKRMKTELDYLIKFIES